MPPSTASTTSGTPALRRTTSTSPAWRVRRRLKAAGEDFAVPNEKVKYGHGSLNVRSEDATPVAADWHGDGDAELLVGDDRQIDGKRHGREWLVRREMAESVASQR